MANPEHLEILKQGVEVWNAWRNMEPDTHPLLDETGRYKPDLSGLDLSEIDLRFAYLFDVNFRKADLSKADLSFANLGRANLSYAKLTEADLSYTGLMLAKLGYANLKGAFLVYANLAHASLSRADLSNTMLHNANFNSVNLNHTNFTNAIFAYTNFSNTDLSTAKGLDTVQHRAPSPIGIDTIYLSQGKIPEVFLRACGVPEDFITYMHSLTVQPIQFYKSFISYSSRDQKFADRLYADLQNKGVRCWLASEDLKIGDRIRVGIDEAIRLHDKLLLVLSKNSVASDWVEQEVETALERERKEKRLILFPIRLDDAVMKIEGGWPALIRNTRNIGDFRKWKDHDSYQKAFDRLLRDLKAEGKHDSKQQTSKSQSR